MTTETTLFVNENIWKILWKIPMRSFNLNQHEKMKWSGIGKIVQGWVRNYKVMSIEIDLDAKWSKFSDSIFLTVLYRNVENGWKRMEIEFKLAVHKLWYSISMITLIKLIYKIPPADWQSLPLLSLFSVGSIDDVSCSVQSSSSGDPTRLSTCFSLNPCSFRRSFSCTWWKLGLNLGSVSSVQSWERVSIVCLWKGSSSLTMLLGCARAKWVGEKVRESSGILEPISVTDSDIFSIRKHKSFISSTYLRLL